ISPTNYQKLILQNELLDFKASACEALFPKIEKPLLSQEEKQEDLIFLKESLEKASEEQKEKLLFTKLKNPLYGLLFAFLLPGLDR
ncbi:hypothetical protein VWN77_10275, partial [Campylobacter coli]